MKKPFFPIGFLLQVTLLIFLGALMSPMPVFSGAIYQCSDQAGNVTLSSHPMEGQTCRQVGSYEDKKKAPDNPEKLQHVGPTVSSAGATTTKVIIRGNSVFVPATIVYGIQETNVALLLDTGATATAITHKVADRLFMNLNQASKVRAGVVGGAVIEASRVKINRLSVGPHTVLDWDIFVVPHEGSAANYDGLLGMDLLRNFNYRVDFKRQVIVWE